MQLKKFEIKAYVTKELHQLVAKEALIRKKTMTTIIREGLTYYFQLREELANAIDAPGNIGDSHTGKIIHTLLARSEQRSALLIEGLDKQISLAQEQLRLITAMLDQFYLDLMKYIPKIPSTIIESATATAISRHKEWLETISKILSEREDQ